MKVQNDQLQALQGAEAHRKPKVAADGFSDLFADVLNADATGSDVAQGLQSSGAFASNTALAMLVQESASLAGLDGDTSDKDSSSMDLAADKIGGLLDKWDNYAKSLSGQNKTGDKSNSDLRSIYGLLDNMSQEVQSLRSTMPDLAKQNSNLDSVLNELEVMTTTEKFKFNRGDYL